MTTVHSNVPSRRSSPYSSGGVTEAEIDQSTRVPVLFFLGAGIFWLIVSSLLGLIVSLKSHWPTFLDASVWLTYGRVQAAFNSAFLYGWTTSIAIAVGLWLMARLSQNCLRHGAVLLGAGAFWNIGVLGGIGGILLGESTGLLALEMPAFTGPVLLIAYVLIAAWGVFTFYARQYQTTYASQWYLLAALFWFPWIFSVAHMMLVSDPVRGTVQSVLNLWYAWNFVALWLAPVALAVIYYFLPKLLGRPIRYYYLASIGFWTYALIAPWAGVARLTGGPVPAWVSSAGIVASTLLLVPVAIISLNFHASLADPARRHRAGPSLTFVRFAAIAFTVIYVVGAVVAYRNFQEVIQFTHFNTGVWMLTTYAFFSMAMFGAVYFLLPRVLVREWTAPGLVRAHFWCSAAGILILAAALMIGGWVQGSQMNDPEVPIGQVVQSTLPWLVGASVGWVILLAGHVLFAWNVIAMAASREVSQEASAVLLTTPPEMKVKVQST